MSVRDASKLLFFDLQADGGNVQVCLCHIVAISLPQKHTTVFK